MNIKIPKWILIVPLLLVCAYVILNGALSLRSQAWEETRQCGQCDTELSVNERWNYPEVCPNCGVGGKYQRCMVVRTTYDKPWYLSITEVGTTEYKKLERLE